jgi:hypothetical protein
MMKWQHRIIFVIVASSVLYSFIYRYCQSTVATEKYFTSSCNKSSDENAIPPKLLVDDTLNKSRILEAPIEEPKGSIFDPRKLYLLNNLYNFSLLLQVQQTSC